MSYPTTPVWEAVNLESDSPTLVSTTVSGRMQSRKIAGQRWAFTASYPPMTRADFMPVWAYIVSKRGQYSTFTVIPPIIGNARGVATGTPLVNGAQSVGDTTIVTDGWTVSTTGIMKAGDFIKFSGHDKVYMVVSDANSDGSGNTTLTIEPQIITALSDNETITVNNVPFTMRLDKDAQEYKMGTNQFVKFDVDFVESL